MFRTEFTYKSAGEYRYLRLIGKRIVTRSNLDWVLQWSMISSLSLKLNPLKEMSKAFEEINAGLEDAINHAKGKNTKVVVHQPEPIDVRAIREKTGMSQQKFCATFGISLGTLRHWEQGLRSPRGPARVLLKVVDNDPKAVMRVVGT